VSLNKIDIRRILSKTPRPKRAHARQMRRNTWGFVRAWRAGRRILSGFGKGRNDLAADGTAGPAPYTKNHREKSQTIRQAPVRAFLSAVCFTDQKPYFVTLTDLTVEYAPVVTVLPAEQ